eukprot:CAMPEP_0181204768 /NCGR_PEP_ID=MMETSP1096-20121128/20114_1 /TAXON_ID=156174 ORGANISM="Chrysochromulina ericina, Strain CCMP281" /NCGR_SAMPLE_ID=MMETSP1096 /ASSEMBLY_ACC=CAM_ASM_000453 /LENGTH=119 /DNA_ID=CAMNT_0023295495 /DNA_START=513 /DNA_END=873 /DNA_ORIENTATION=+
MCAVGEHAGAAVVASATEAEILTDDVLYKLVLTAPPDEPPTTPPLGFGTAKPPHVARPCGACDDKGRLAVTPSSSSIARSAPASICGGSASGPASGAMLVEPRRPALLISALREAGTAV